MYKDYWYRIYATLACIVQHINNVSGSYMLELNTLHTKLLLARMYKNWHLFSYEKHYGMKWISYAMIDHIYHGVVFLYGYKRILYNCWSDFDRKATNNISAKIVFDFLKILKQMFTGYGYPKHVLRFRSESCYSKCCFWTFSTSQFITVKLRCWCGKRQKAFSFCFNLSYMCYLILMWYNM